MIHIHGLADQNIRYDGRPGTGVTHIDGPPVEEVVAQWRTVDECAAPTTRTDAPVSTTIATCPLGRAVELVTIAGAGHQWPGSSSRSRAERLGLVDPPSRALDATQVIWQFFRDHPAPDAW